VRRRGRKILESKFKLITLFSHTHTEIVLPWPTTQLNDDHRAPQLLRFHRRSSLSLSLVLLFFISILHSHTFLTISHSHQFSHFRSIRKSLDDSTPNLTKLLSDCIYKFKDNHRYRNDFRFLKIWFLYVTSFLPQSSLSFSNNFIFISIYLLF
jgi:hypothetical protein